MDTWLVVRALIAPVGRDVTNIQCLGQHHPQDERPSSWLCPIDCLRRVGWTSEIAPSLTLPHLITLAKERTANVKREDLKDNMFSQASSEKQSQHSKCCGQRSTTQPSQVVLIHVGPPSNQGTDKNCRLFLPFGEVRKGASIFSHPSPLIHEGGTEQATWRIQVGRFHEGRIIYDWWVGLPFYPKPILWLRDCLCACRRLLLIFRLLNRDK